MGNNSNQVRQFSFERQEGEAVTSMFATSLLIFFHQTDLSAHSSKYEHIKKKFGVSTVNDLSDRKVEERCTYRLKEILTILI